METSTEILVSDILEVWAAPGAPKALAKVGGLSPPPFGMVSGAPGAAQSPKMTDSPAYGWPDFREDKMINPAPGFWLIFGPLGAHGGPREPRERPQL